MTCPANMSGLHIYHGAEISDTWAAVRSPDLWRLHDDECWHPPALDLSRCRCGAWRPIESVARARSLVIEEIHEHYRAVQEEDIYCPWVHIAIDLLVETVRSEEAVVPAAVAR